MATKISPELRRRKIRKGTQSCWECKRRKVRCTFAHPAGPVCDGCSSRRVKCISQEFHDDPMMAKRKANRLDCAETLVAQLSRQADLTLSNALRHSPENTRGKTVCGIDSRTSSAHNCISTSIPGLSTTLVPNTQSEGEYTGLCRNLLDAWPSQSELDLLASVDIGISAICHGTVCMPYSTFLSRHKPSLQDLLQKPPPGSHPVLIARQLLMLGTLLQAVPPDAVKDLERLGVNCHQTMSHLVNTASRLATSNDELVNSLEGIECIMIEGMYQNNAGNLRRAWLTNRRAMLTAQMIGLHTGTLQLANVLDVKTRGRIDPEYMWLRMVMSDRYLSLMIGLPQGSQDSSFATTRVLEACAPIERLERMEVLVAGLILQRDRLNTHDLDETYRIDKMLQDAAASMPAEWWLIPNVNTTVTTDTNAFSETVRFTNQFAHYHLLARLHLPYMLQSPTDRKYDYSKITCVNASREILSRFVYFRDASTVTAYCRGIDMLAFIASTTLCLAHINVRSQDRPSANSHKTIFRFLVHQRLGDRGLMERTLQNMEKMSRINNDAMAHKIVSILQRLLAIEAAAANGNCYNASISTQPDKRGILCSDAGSNENDTLSINIPHFGTLKIEQGGDVRYIDRECPPPGEPDSSDPVSQPFRSGTAGFVESNSSQDCDTHRSAQEASLSTTCFPHQEFIRKSAIDNRKTMLLHVESSESHEEPHPADGNEGLDSELLDMQYESIPGLSADASNWALQGVDTVLFDSLFEGSGLFS